MEIKPQIETFARIKVVGVGGAGGSPPDRMIQTQGRGGEFVAVNADAQALHHSGANRKVHIGREATKGLGAGADPEIGRAAAEESLEKIEEALRGSDMVFLVAGMGGGTGTGASPIVAELAREVGALTVAVVTKPFAFEGEKRRRVSKLWMLT